MVLKLFLCSEEDKEIDIIKGNIDSHPWYAILGGILATQKSESRMTTVCTAFSDCGSFQNPSDDTSPILSSIKTSHVPNQSK